MNKILIKETDEVLDLCKVEPLKLEEDKLMFVDLTRDMFKDNPSILKKYFRNENLYECAYANLLAFRDIPDITLYEIKKELKKDFGKKVSLAGFKYNPEHYKFANEDIQNEYEEDLFRYKDEEEEKSIIEPIDFDAVETLYSVLFKAIKARLVMILNLEDIPSILNNAYDCYHKGVTCSVSNNAMHSKIKEIRTLLENTEMIEWLKSQPTDLMFDKNDYIITYQKVLRQLTSIKNETLECCRDLLDNPEDLFIDDIIKNESLDIEQLFNNLDEDDEDYLD